MSYAGPSTSGRSSVSRPAGPSKPALGPPPLRAPVRATPGGGNRTAIFTLGLAIGIAVGAAVTLLIAPQSGEETRRSIARRGRKLTRRGRDAWDDLRDELRAARRRRREEKAERAEMKRASESP